MRFDKIIMNDIKEYANEGGEHKLMEYEIKHILAYINHLENEKEQLKVWLNDLIDKNNDIYELYKDDVLHYEYQINNARYQNNIFLAILDKIDNLEKEVE